MATPNPTRGTRSRISSPFAPVPSIESPVSATDKPKTMLQNWVASAANAKVQDGEKMSWQEPALAPQRASFAEAGHVRHSIVQNMMPLGVGPPAKVLKALAKGESERAKSLVNSTISTPEPAGETDTPEVVPEDTAPEPVEEEDPVEEDTVMATEAVIPEASIEPDVEESSQQAAPTPPPQEPETIEEDIKASRTATEQPATVQNNEVRLSIEPQSSAQSVIAAEHSSPAAQALPPSKPPRYPRWISETPEPALGPDGLAIINLAFTDKIVESAVQEALDRQRWPTAYALRVLWDVLRTDPNMVRMFDAVYNGWHNPEQMSTFQSIVRSKKREGRKDRQAEYYFNGDLPPAPAIHSAIKRVNPPAPMYQTPYASARPSADVTEQIRSSSIASNFSPLLAAALSVDASPEASDEHINKKQRSNSFQPSNDDVKQHSRVNGTNDVTMSDANVVNGNDTTIGTHGSVQENGVSHKGMKSTSPVENGAAPKSTSRAHRSRSNSTSSSLSSVDEKVLEDPTIISPHRPHPANTSHARPIAVPFQTMSSVSSLPRSFSMAQFYSAPTPQQRASPYTSSDTFKVAAREASNAARPVAPPKNGPKTFTFKTAPKLPSPAPPQRSSPATLQSTAATSAAPAKSSAEEMAPSSPVQPSKATTAPSKKLPLTFKQKNAKKVVGVALDDSDNSNQMKRKAKEITTGKKDPDESFERHHVGGEENGWASDGGDSIAVKATKKPKKTPKVRLLNRSRETRQNSRYASEEGSSPTELGFKAPFPVSDSVPSSRAGTPIAANRLSRKPKTGSGLRVKTSPMKKKTGPSAGIPKGLRSPPGNSGPTAQDGENDEFCSACGGNGELVCCDGCTRSFHFKCVDPPIPDEPDSNAWFCNICESKRRSPIPDENTTKGIWGPILSDFEDTNPRSFSLPLSIREYFVDVKTGTEGEYEEVVPPKPKNNKAGWEEAPDYFRTRDAKGKVILCHQCNGEASAPNRMIVPCTYCSLSWHLDCIPVPLAKEPGPGRQWRCPAHVDDLLLLVPQAMGPAHRFRKIKGAPAIKSAMSRGVKNSGHIEIENDPSEDEAEPGFYEVREFGHTYKLSENSIKLDFISRVKQTRGDYNSVYAPRPRVATGFKSAPSDQPAWDRRALDDQQAALNLASLHAQTKDSVAGDGAGILINALLAEATPATISLISQATSSGLNSRKPTRREKQSMTAMFELLKRKLADAESSSEEEEPTPATPAEPDVDTEAVSSPANAKEAPETVVGDEDEDEEMLL